MEETAQAEHQTAEEIAASLNNAGHPVGIKDVLPAEDLAYGIESTVGDFTTGKPKVRNAQSKKFLGEHIGRLLKMRKPNEEVMVK